MADSVRATAYWTLSPGHGALREERLRSPGLDDALVRAKHSAISRGTERLVHTGSVPAEIANRMRAPFQEGDFPGPVKYGYLSVGEVEQGPDDLVGADVFCLFPHQDRYVVPVAALTRLPAVCRVVAASLPVRPRQPSTRCGTRRRASGTGSRSSAQA